MVAAASGRASRAVALVATFLALKGSPVDAARITVDSDGEVSEDTTSVCPRGLTLHVCPVRGALCEFSVRAVPEPRPGPNLPQMQWGNTSSVPVYFFQNGGVNVEYQFVAELTAAASGPLGRDVLDSVLGHGADMAHSKDRIDSIHTIDEQKNETWSDTIAHAQHTLHSVEANLRPAFTVAHHYGEHVVLAAVIDGLHGLSHAAEVGHVIGGEAVVTVLEAAGAGLHSLELALISPYLLAPTAAYVVWQMSDHYRTKRVHASRFSTELAVKSRCMTERGVLTLSAAEQFLRPQVSEICGLDAAKLISQQTVRTNAAVMEMFERSEEVGRCLFPVGSRAWSKTNCAEALFESLHSVHGQNGVLHTALAMVETYGREADDFFTHPVYGSWFEHEFGKLIPPPADNSAFLEFAKLASKDPEAKSVACLSLLATHRAYERTFMRLKVSLGVYMQTFARDISQATLRTSWHPCRRVATKLEEGHDTGDGFCKDMVPFGSSASEISDTIWEAAHVGVGPNSTSCELGEERAHPLWPGGHGHGDGHGDGHATGDHAVSSHDPTRPTTMVTTAAPATAPMTTTRPAMCCSCPVSIGYMDNRAECEEQCVQGKTTCNHAEAAYCVAVPCEALPGADAEALEETDAVTDTQELEDEVAVIAADIAQADDAEEEQLELVRELSGASIMLEDYVAKHRRN